MVFFNFFNYYTFIFVFIFNFQVATHHHSLPVELVKEGEGNVALCYMMCESKFDEVSQGNERKYTPPTDVVFLYKCSSGICPKR
jgi:hypothetical protein